MGGGPGSGSRIPPKKARLEEGLVERALLQVTGGCGRRRPGRGDCGGRGHCGGPWALETTGKRKWGRCVYKVLLGGFSRKWRRGSCWRG